MLIKRQPKLSWLINFLAILLMCLLIANSILGSIYINNLKNRMSDITDNYFLAEQKLQNATEALTQTQITLLKYQLADKTSESDVEFNKIKTNILLEFQKNEVNLSSLLLSLKKQETNHYMEESIATIYSLTTQYLLNIEHLLSIPKIITQAQIDESTITYLKIKEYLDSLTEILRQKAYAVKSSDSLIIEYLPPILIASFFIALIIGGSLIYVSRREVRKSVIEETTHALAEAYQYQRDCLQTLEFCKEIIESRKNSNHPHDFDLRQDLHKKEISNLERLLNNMKTIKE